MLAVQSVNQSCKQVAFITLSGSESVQHVVWARKWSLFSRCGGWVEGNGEQFNMSKWWGGMGIGWQCKKELSHSSQQMSLTAFWSIIFKRFRSSLHYYDGSPRCSHLQSARQQCLWSNSSPRSLRCWPVEPLSAHRTRILGKQQGERSGQWRYAWISVLSDAAVNEARWDESPYLAAARTFAGGCKLCGSSEVGRPLGQLMCSMG